MKTRNLYLFTYFNLCILVILHLLSACTEQTEDKEENKKYSIHILGFDKQEYLLQTNSLTEGILTPEKNGVLLNDKIVSREMIVKSGNYYHLDSKNNKLSRYVKTTTRLKETGVLNIEDFRIENFCWLNPDTLLLVGLDRKTSSIPKYHKINTTRFNIIESGPLPLPKPQGKFESTSIGFIHKRENKLFIGFTFHQFNESYNYNSSDTIYMATLNYPELTLTNIEKDTRSAYPGGINTVQPYSFTNENGDFYFMTCPGIAMGNMPNEPTGIFRIKADENLLDQNYFFNISSIINNHAYGLWYLGNNKAIVRSERKDLYTNFRDLHSTYNFEFHLLDLKNQSTQKINLPLDKGTRKECVIVEKGTAYIAVNAGKENNYIWIYDIKSGTLKKGVQLSGETDYIFRIDRNF